MVRVDPVSSGADLEAVRGMFREYAVWIDLDLGFQDFESELATLPGAYSPPGGALFIAREGDSVSGCVAIRPFQPPSVAELKRLFVRPEARGLGVGRALTEAAIDAARSAGYGFLRLDTLPMMGSAQRLYESLGFYEIDPYRFNPVSGALYLELDLRPSRGASHD